MRCGLPSSGLGRWGWQPPSPRPSPSREREKERGAQVSAGDAHGCSLARSCLRDASTDRRR